jgi:uncharacterized protein YgiM (DUF1202 family)
METLGYLVSDRTSPTLLIPDFTATLPVIGLASSLVLTSWSTQLPQAQAALSRNDRCSAVTDLQNALIRAGFDPGTTDGVFGGATEYAVMRFQEKNELKSDRIVGEATATALGLDANIACETNTSQNPTPGTGSNSDDSIAVISLPVRFGKVITESGPLNVRSGPSVDYSVVSTVANGASVRFVGQPVGAWLQLVDGGWIHSDWVEFVKADAANGGENKTAETSQTSTTKTATAQSTTTPATTAQSTTTPATTTPATTTPATSSTPSTTPSSTAEQTSTLEAKGGPATAVEVKDLRFQRAQVSTGGSALNVRESAQYDAKVLNQLEDGEEVVVLVPKDQQTLPEWVKLSSGGWVSSNWLEAKDTIAPQG